MREYEKIVKSSAEEKKKFEQRHFKSKCALKDLKASMKSSSLKRALKFHEAFGRVYKPPESVSQDS